jgi:hypothetical protein
MGLLHLVQIGGGGFFGMLLTLIQARVLPNSLSPETAEAGAVMGGLIIGFMFKARQGYRGV